MATATATNIKTTKTTITRRKSYKYRIYPTPAQTKKFDFTLNSCRELYNAALQERKDAYRQWKRLYQYVTPEVAKPSITCYSQCKELTKVKEVRPELYEVNSQVLQDVLHRVDKTFQAFFSRCKEGKKPGYPRFKSYQRYNSFTYPQYGWTIHNEKLTLHKIPGTVKVRLHRKVIGKVKTCTIVREENGSKWYVVFSVEQEFEQPTTTVTDLDNLAASAVVGIDLGLEHFANLSNGEQVENPRLFRKSEKRLACAQRKLAKVQHLSRRDPKKIKAKKAVTRAYRKIRNQRLDFAHKLSHRLAHTYKLIVIEDLNVKGLAASRLSKSVNDAGWSLFTRLLGYKVAETGSKLVKVDPCLTSQTCPDCGAINKKELSERWHSCPCGCEMHRDIAAAKVILSRGLSTLRNQSVNAS
jgi:putative transposase